MQHISCFQAQMFSFFFFFFFCTLNKKKKNLNFMWYFIVGLISVHTLLELETRFVFRFDMTNYPQSWYVVDYRLSYNE